MSKVNMSYKPQHIFSDLSSKMFTWNNCEYIESDEYKRSVDRTVLIGRYIRYIKTRFF